jgi:cell division protease FtsH
LLIFGEVTTGASNDIERVTKIARSMVTEYGMSDVIGPVALGHKEELVFLGRDLGEQKNYSEQTAREIDQEVRRIIQEAFKKATDVLSQNRPRLIMISERLIKEETLEASVFEALFNQPLDDEDTFLTGIVPGTPDPQISLLDQSPDQPLIKAPELEMHGMLGTPVTDGNR